MDTSSIVTPQTISVQQLMTLKSQKVKPIDGLNIPNITIPPHLISKKRATEAIDTLSINIRQLFNSISSDNLSSVKEELRKVICEKAKSVEMIEEIAQEILLNFVISEQNIKNYMHLLNAVSPACVLISPISENSEKTGTTKNVSSTIGNFFLNKCKDMIFNYTSDAKIRELSKMDQEDLDQLDAYNREREKIINLITTICCLYAQRNTSNIKLTGIHLYSLMSTIMISYNKCQSKMKELGNPYEEDCSDEEEYEILRKMSTLYAEQLYTFMYREGKEFNKDPIVVKGQTLKDLVDRFRTEIVPTISEAYLVSKCEDVEY